MPTRRPNPDLLWAVRGSGSGFFGVVTRFTLDVYERPKAIFRSAYVYPLDELDAVLRFAMEVEEQLPAERRVRPARDDPAPARGRLRRGRHRAGRRRRRALRDRGRGPRRPRAARGVPRPRPRRRPRGRRPDRDGRAVRRRGRARARGLALRTGQHVDGRGAGRADPGGARAVHDRPQRRVARLLVALARPGAARHGLLGAGEALHRRVRCLDGRERRRGGSRTWGVDHMRRLEPFSVGIQLADENLLARPHARYLSEENSARLEALRAEWDPDGLFHCVPDRRADPEARRDRDPHARRRQGLAPPAARAGHPPRRRGRPGRGARGDRRARGPRSRVVDERLGVGGRAVRRRMPKRRTTPEAQREAWLQAYRFAFLARYPTLNHPLKHEWYDRTREYFANAGALDDPPLQAVTVPFEGRDGEGSELHFYVQRPARSRAAAGRDDVGRDRHVEGGDAQPRRVSPRPRLRDAARRHARDRPVAGAREPRRRASVDSGLRLARPRRTTSTARASPRSARRSAATGR